MEPLYLYLTFFIILISLVIACLPKSKPQQAPEKPSEVKEKPKNDSDKPKVSKETPETNKPSLKELKKMNAQSEKQQKAKAKRKVANPEHPSFLNSFKGFAEEISDFTFSQNYLAVACKDRTLKVFKLKQLKDENPFYYMMNLDINYPTCISFNSTNESMFACGLSADRTIALYSFLPSDPAKKYFPLIRRFSSNIHKESVLNVYFLNTGCIITVGGGSDTTIKVWNQNQDLLNTVDTKQVKHNFATISASSRLLFVGSWCPDVKVFEVKLDKNDKSFKSLGKIMDLGLHKTGIDYISCSQNEERVVTISQDRTVRVWTISTDYDPKCILTVDMKSNAYFGENCNITAGDVWADKEGKGIVALAEKNDIVLINLDGFKVLDKIERAHSEESIIRTVKIMRVENETYLFSYGSLDCRINVFKLNL